MTSKSNVTEMSEAEYYALLSFKELPKVLKYNLHLFILT
jgi:hypothetical protein